MELKKWGPLRGEITVPGDKSISHRAVMFGSLAKGTTEIHGFLQGADCLSTISCFEKMGVSIENKGDVVLVHGNGLHGLKKPETILDCVKEISSKTLQATVCLPVAWVSSMVPNVWVC